ncbi:hypothetical protein DJ013_20030 [Arcticibacterium luteifluviistationis]|uniref:DUF1565 domain-containing protein n=1 Tax=Arcticibacterium luteifluviistationis TaxID=1784714 RepID=A0A2Z4GGX9_9BACT|nr:hypothetical protein DJ013_20030 [Arcticibacterium luteifluviistationis]
MYVNKNASGAENGSSWTDAYTDLQDALSKGKYVTAWVAAGTYKPTSGTDRNISFQIPDNVKVYGGFIGNEANNYELYIF